MIVFNLICLKCDYSFEGWFESTSAYNNQKRRKLINCPSCNSSKINKTLNAPNVGKKSNSVVNKNKKTIANNIKKIKKIVEENFDYVGDKFTEEAKKIKYGETNDRPIYGEATIEQTKQLVDEEIDVVPLPFHTNKKSN